MISFGSNNQMTSMGTAFASLLTIGAVAIGDSCRLTTFGNAFANVRTIDRCEGAYRTVRCVLWTHVTMLRLHSVCAGALAPHPPLAAHALCRWRPTFKLALCAVI